MNLVGKKLKDLVTDDTIFKDILNSYANKKCDKCIKRKDNKLFHNEFIKNVCEQECNVKDLFIEEYGEKEIKEDINITNYGDIIVVTGIIDYNYLLVFKDDKLDIVFSVYDLENYSYHAKAQMLIATGHETAHEYFVPDREYSYHYTR